MRRVLALVTPFCVTLAGSAFAAPATTLDVRDYGAVCNGVVDDTLALRAAIAAADTAPYRTMLLPPSVCVFKDTLTFGGLPSRYSSISMQGHSEYTSVLSYQGPTDRPALRINHMAAFTWARLSVQRSLSGNRGTSIGIEITGPGTGGGGTANSLLTFDHVLVQGFHMGMLAGTTVNAASELECRQCVFSYNNIGFTSNGYNALNFWFYGLGMAHNVIGMQMGGPWVSDAVHVYGGHSSGNTQADFYTGNSFGVLSIDGFRAEVTASGAKFLTSATVGSVPSRMVLRNSVILGTATQVVMDLATARIETSHITGKIQAITAACHPWSGQQVLTIVDSTILTPTAIGWPVTWPATGFYRFRLTGNAKGGAVWLDDHVGTFDCGVVTEH